MKNIYVLDRDDNLKNDLTEMFKADKGIKVKKYDLDDFDKILKNIPDILVINEDELSKSENIIEICKKIRSDEDNSITPIIILSSNKDVKHKIEILKNEVELYLEKPTDKNVLYYSIKNIMRLLNSNRMVSPLTGLPGNVQIQAEMKKRLQNGQNFAMLYIDLDNFKAYNDTYGFSNGDEIIKFTAKVIMHNVLKDDNEQNFVGHIGGDDFVGIIPDIHCERVCQDIIANFDANVKKFFTEADKEKGYIEVANRKGIIEQFPLVSLSIGVVVCDIGRFHNILEIGEVGAQVKHAAKSVMGSCYAVDRRK